MGKSFKPFKLEIFHIFVPVLSQDIDFTQCKSGQFCIQ
jgi:hypothetical protein